MSSTHSAGGGPKAVRQSSRPICPCKRSARPFLPFFPVRGCVACCSGGISLPGRSHRHLRRVLLQLSTPSDGISSTCTSSLSFSKKIKQKHRERPRSL